MNTFHRLREDPMTATTEPTETNAAGDVSRRARWLALYVLCLGDLMIVLDQSIVNVALPSIRDDLGFTSRRWPGWSTPTC